MNKNINICYCIRTINIHGKKFNKSEKYYLIEEKETGTNWIFSDIDTIEYGYRFYNKNTNSSYDFEFKRFFILQSELRKLKLKKLNDNKKRI